MQRLTTESADSELFGWHDELIRRGACGLEDTAGARRAPGAGYLASCMMGGTGCPGGTVRRDEWLHLARELDWHPSYVEERQLFPESMSGSPWLPAAEWAAWDEPFRTAF